MEVRVNSLIYCVCCLGPVSPPSPLTTNHIISNLLFDDDDDEDDDDFFGDIYLTFTLPLCQ